MSNATQESSSNDNAETRQFIINNRIIIASSAMYCYEWLITLDQEVKLFWTGKQTLATWIFSGSRYSTLFLVILTIPPTPTYDSCKWILRTQGVLTLLQSLTLALFTGLRTSALCGRNIWLFLLVSGLSAVPFIVNTVEFFKSKLLFVVTSPDNICETFVTWNSKLILGLSLGTRLAAIAADAIALVVSWRKAQGVVREAARLQMRVSLGRVLVRDGTVLFLGLLAVNGFQILATNVPSIAESQLSIAVLSTFPSIFMCRFMLNLRQAIHQPASDITDTRLTIRFNADILVGNLGESLGDGGDDDDASEIETLPDIDQENDVGGQSSTSRSYTSTSTIC